MQCITQIKLYGEIKNSGEKPSFAQKKDEWKVRENMGNLLSILKDDMFINYLKKCLSTHRILLSSALLRNMKQNSIYFL